MIWLFLKAILHVIDIQQALEAKLYVGKPFSLGYLKARILALQLVVLPFHYVIIETGTVVILFSLKITDNECLYVCPALQCCANLFVALSAQRILTVPEKQDG